MRKYFKNLGKALIGKSPSGQVDDLLSMASTQSHQKRFKRILLGEIFMENAENKISKIVINGTLNKNNQLEVYAKILY